MQEFVLENCPVPTASPQKNRGPFLTKGDLPLTTSLSTKLNGHHFKRAFGLRAVPGLGLYFYVH